MEPAIVLLSPLLPTVHISSFVQVGFLYRPCMVPYPVELLLRLDSGKVA